MSSALEIAAKELSELIANANSSETAIQELAGVGRTTETVKGNATDLITHKAETITQIYNAKTEYAAVGDGVANDVSALQAANDAIVASGKQGTLFIPPGVYKIDSTLTIDLSYVSIWCMGKIDASAITSGVAIQFIGSVAPPYTQSMTVVEGIQLAGNGKAGTVKGFSFDTTAIADEGTSHTTFRNCNISFFGTGLYFKDRAYIQNFYGFDIWQCGICVDSPASVTDGGERITFHGCVFFNSDLAVKVLNPNSSWNFMSCSFDYNLAQFEINASKVFLHQSHIEAGKTTYTTTPIKVSGDGGCFVMNGGWLLQTGSGTATNNYVVDCSDYSAGVYFDGVFMNNNKSATNYFATGTGFVKVTNSMSYATSTNNRLISSTMNLLGDGGFEQTTIQDNIFISSDTAAITDPTVGTNVTLTTSTDELRTGLRSLKMAKVNGGGTACHFTVAVPIDRGSKAAHEWWYKKPGTSTGNVFVSARWASIKYNNDGVPMILKGQTIASTTISFTSVAVDWTRNASGEPSVRVPNWATHYVITINADGLSTGGILYFDDLLINEM